MRLIGVTDGRGYLGKLDLGAGPTLGERQKRLEAQDAL
jgi:hypothetical protein